MIDRSRLEQGWVGLADADPDVHGFATLPTTEEVDGRPVLQALDREGRRHILVPAPGTQVPEDRTSAGVKVLPLKLESKGRTEAFGAIRCELPRLATLFDDVVVDLVSAAVDAPADPIGACISALDEWRALLRSVRPKSVSIAQLVGLLAELLFVREVVAEDPARRLDFWVGKEGQRHDLRRGGAAIEVKATTANEGRMVGIHGLSQLESPGELHLAWARFERVPSGTLNLTTLIDRIRALGVPAQAIHAGLDERGLPPGAGSEETFELREDRIYKVADGFPHLTKSVIRDGVKLEGVHDVRYSVDLDTASDFLLDTEARSEMIHAFATAPADAET